eukprot:5397664-Pyramimonas_sp.AAC.1
MEKTLQAVARTAFQRIVELITFRAMEEKTKGKRNNQQIAKEYEKELTQRAGAEKISETLIAQVDVIGKKAFSYPEIFDLFQAVEARAGGDSPFDTISKIYHLCNKASDTDTRFWMFASIDYLHRHGQLRSGELSASILKQAKNVQYIDVLIFKKAVLNELLYTSAPKMDLSKNTCTSLRSAFASHKDYMAMNVKEPGQWQKHFIDFSKEDLMYAQLIDEVVYGTYYDGTLKQCLKFRKTASETLQYGTIGDKMNSIVDHIAASVQKSKDEAGAVPEATAARVATCCEDCEEEDDVVAVDDDDEVEAVKHSFKGLAERLAIQKVDLIVFSDSESALRDALKSTLAIAGELEEGTNRGIIFDSKTNGEAATAPWRRLPPFKQQQAMKMIQATLKAVAGEQHVLDPDTLTIGENDIYMFFDAMKHQQLKTFSDCFAHADVKLNKSQKQYFITYDEEALRTK